jgi:radical SAM superfamily enzyme YgiQ (UPF0313 family)
MEIIAAHRIKRLKLYFMIGLPSESDDDIGEIIRLTFICKDILDRHSGGSRISLSISPFVPKAGTPFQWLPMAPLSILEHRLSLLKNQLQPKGIGIKAESLAWTEVQAVLARGDDALSQVLADIETLSLSGWRYAIRENHVDIDFFAHQRWGTEQELPWALIDSATRTERLKQELDRCTVKIQ